MKAGRPLRSEGQPVQAGRPLRLSARGAALLLVVASLGGCFSSRTPQRRYYVLNLDTIQKPRDVRFMGVVRVRNLDSESAYDRFQIVVRRSPYELEYRELNVWAVKPNRTLSDLLARALQDLELFAGVTRTLSEQRPDYVFGGDLHAIEIFDSGDQWFVHLDVTLTLTAYETGRTLWSYRFEQRKEVGSRNFSHATRALSELLSNAVQQAVNSLVKSTALRPLQARSQPQPPASVVERPPPQKRQQQSSSSTSDGTESSQQSSSAQSSKPKADAPDPIFVPEPRPDERPD